MSLSCRPGLTVSAYAKRQLILPVYYDTTREGKRSRRSAGNIAPTPRHTSTAAQRAQQHCTYRSRASTSIARMLSQHVQGARAPPLPKGTSQKGSKAKLHAFSCSVDPTNSLNDKKLDPLTPIPLRHSYPPAIALLRWARQL